MKTPYEGIPVPDGEYQLGQLSKSGYGRVLKIRNDPDYELHEDMPVEMPDDTFEALFKYVGSRGESSIHDFTAVVKNNKIVHVY